MRIKNILLVLLTITTIASTSLAVYFGINQKKEEESQTQDIKTQEENNEAVQNQEEQEEYSRVFKFDDEINVVNKTNKIYTQTNQVGLPQITAQLTNNNVKLYFSSDAMGFSGIEQYRGTSNIEIKFTDKKVQNIYFMGAGQLSGSFCLFFLMEDGTLEYMPLAYAIKNNDFRSYGKIEGIEDITYLVSAVTENRTNTTLAVQKDGTAYDLEDQINDIYYNQYPIYDFQ